jgi:phosphoribosylformylglycinamidine synthase
LAAHDLSDGGLAVALAESCLRGGTGCRVRLPDDPFTWLFSESAARAIVAVAPDAAGGFDELAGGFDELCAAHGVPATTLGVAGGDGLVVEDWFSVGLAELAAAHTPTLPALFA